MTGSGRLTMFRIVGPKKQREGPGNISDAYWDIRPEEGGSGEGVGEIGTLIYGKVPKGYKQFYPEKGEPPQLVEGEKYEAYAITTGADPAIKYFTIENGKAVELPSR
jgi:hypothetical protein